MPADGPPLLRPTPRRPFDLNVTSATPPESSTPVDPGEQTSPNYLDARANGNGGADLGSFSRTRSVLNLTSSTLFGIYSPTGNNEREEPSTPWGTGAETPRERGSFDGLPPAYDGRTERSQHGRESSQQIPMMPLSNHILNLALRIFLLFCFGMGYGVLVTHLHNDQQLAPFQVEGIMKPSYNWSYLVFWGVSGVGLGSLLPWVDTIWEDTSRDRDSELASEKERLSTMEDEERVSSASRLAADWNPVVRSIGAFVGIAFAIRKLPWTSTFQASLTLALVNPVLWYLIDRSKPGFLLSALVGIFGTTVLLSLNPEMMPSPAMPTHIASGNSTHSLANEVFGGLVARETVECGTWIISVLFCSCVCFGNIGRRLALKKARPVQGKVRRDSFI